MSLFAITNGGETTVIEAPSKSAANAYAHQNVKIDVRLATKADLAGLDLATVPNVVKGGKTEEQVAEAKRKADEAAAKKAAEGTPQ